MESFVRVSGIAAPMMRINIDTDQIIPAKYLVRLSDTGISDGLFAGWRFHPDGSLNPDFILNIEPWTKSQIILADRNFGCGSSREAAPKALREWGIRAVIAPSFGGIFYNNSFRNGLLPVELPIEQVRILAEQVEAAKGKQPVTVDLETSLVTAPDGRTFTFQVPPMLRQMLLEGLDEIDVTLSRLPVIEKFRAKDRIKRPWSYSPGLVRT